MIAAWYGVISFMLIAYVVLDGRNFGAGMIHWIVAKTPEERRLSVCWLLPGAVFDPVWLDTAWHFHRSWWSHQ